MATTREDIARWFKRGVKEKATHLIVRCDTFDWSDYPAYAHSAEEARKIAGDSSNMQKTMEVYNLKMPMEEQLNQHRSFNY